jgi:hypothetical protein
MILKVVSQNIRLKHLLLFGRQKMILALGFMKNGNFFAENLQKMMPKFSDQIPFCNFFGGPWNGQCWYMFCQPGHFFSHLVYF